jgi:hypothetical protein
MGRVVTGAAADPPGSSLLPPLGRKIGELVADGTDGLQPHLVSIRHLLLQYAIGEKLFS